METMCLKSGIVPTISISGSLDARASSSQVGTVGRSAGDKPPHRSVFSRLSFWYPLESLWPRGNSSRYRGLALDDAVLVDNGEAKAVRDDVEGDGTERHTGNWVLKILHIKSAWEGKQRSEEEGGVRDQTNEEEVSECDACGVDEDDGDGDEEEAQFDRGSFSRMLRRVSLAEARLYAQMSHLGNLAYDIPKIKPGKLLKHYGLRYVTSSIEKKELAATAEKDSQKVGTDENEEEEEERKDPKNGGYKISSTAAYNIAASAATYLHSQTRSIFPFKSSNAVTGEGSVEGSNGSLNSVNMINKEVASLMATTDSVTAVVAAKEEVKQAVADDLNSAHSTPCEWFLCDDDQSGTRHFVIQGSETMASWQANLLFEPIKFEGLDVLVHRGIYEAAKGMYQQMLPEVHAHIKSRGSRATFRFTGHSLGGSLALLVNLMLLIRHEVPISSLLPVITFGSPSIMCGGDSLLEKLGLPRSHVQAITMHRDIVPRAFSCNYPNHVAELLKAVNRNFRGHPCLNKQKLLYAPMGNLLILQPDEKFSPSHHLLPSGSGLYLLGCPFSESNGTEKQLRAAQMVFLNSPHPLEILSDRSAYGSGGTIQRDHDMNSYLKSVRTVIRQELNQIRKTKREQRRKVWWPLVLPRGIDASIVGGRSMISINVGQRQSPFSGMIQTGRQSLKRFSRLVTSQHMHLFVLLLFPVRLLLLGTFSQIGRVRSEQVSKLSKQTFLILLALKMFLTRTEYDRGVNTFSPEGRLFQVEYAIEAIKLGSTAIGLKTKEGVVLAVEKRITSPLLEPSSVEKIMEIDEHIGCAMSGLIADARTLVEHARVETQNHRFSYGEAMTVESTTQALCDLALRFGEGDEESMSRPFGVSLLIAGHDENGPSLYYTDPSGTFWQCNAKAIGSGSEGADSSLQEQFNKDLTLQEAETIALSILKQVMEEKVTPNNVDIAKVAPTYHLYTPSEVEAVITRL
ncbi:hypothetical protein VNO78_20686 [Psophocarpus tetragonolobus]|uniref:Proteasome alpha-type subunits domain-containing protein n=2 Tax=NPAAA clade TaxID=2231382 RepID=A0AAN9S9V2_PSOTE